MTEPMYKVVLAPDDGPRRCGDCTLCCKLLPIKEDARTPDEIIQMICAMVERGYAKLQDFDGMMGGFNKPAGKRCPHQCHKGCKVYTSRPFSCRTWNCRWLANNADDVRRPDRSHVVIDIVPDYVTEVSNDGSQRRDIEVIQIWVDPKYPDAWREPAVRAYIERRGQDGCASLIRFNDRDGIVVFPPSMRADGAWHEVESRNMGLRKRGDLLAHWGGSA